MSTQVPARIIGEQKKGVLRVGNDADLILLDEQVRLHSTIIAGQCVSSKGDILQMQAA
jgi:N-acetylglucosamine-6-phosphate deacetylase